jgi:hypothetical protein
VLLRFLTPDVVIIFDLQGPAVVNLGGLAGDAVPPIAFGVISTHQFVFQIAA